VIRAGWLKSSLQRWTHRKHDPAAPDDILGDLPARGLTSCRCVYFRYMKHTLPILIEVPATAHQLIRNRGRRADIGEDASRTRPCSCLRASHNAMRPHALDGVSRLNGCQRTTREDLSAAIDIAPSGRVLSSGSPRLSLGKKLSSLSLSLDVVGAALDAFPPIVECKQGDVHYFSPVSIAADLRFRNFRAAHDAVADSGHDANRHSWIRGRRIYHTTELHRSRNRRCTGRPVSRVRVRLSLTHSPRSAASARGGRT
jgi:hypothetical protein